MSSKLIEHSEDLLRLREKGFNITVEGAFLVIRDIPYVTASRTVRHDGVLVTELDQAGDKTITPRRHQMHFAGETPCDAQGQAITALRPNNSSNRINDRLSTNIEFSNKPRPNGYRDFYQKVTNYAGLICGPAQQIDPSSNPFTFRVEEPESTGSPFHYLDTASAGAGIHTAAEKLAVLKIAIVGLGGTGSYILDLLAKTPVKEIHIYDGDKFSSHNAFRAPGAASIERLREQPLKVDYFHEIYSNMHRGISAHDQFIDESNVEELSTMDCVFLAMDSGPGKRLIVDHLDDKEVPFIDAAMGLYEKNDVIGGALQVTTSTSANRDQARSRMSLADADGPNDYARNIQVADLNALNAQLAVVRWKKLRDFYQTYERANFTVFRVGTSLLLNEDQYD